MTEQSIPLSPEDRKREDEIRQIAAASGPNYEWASVRFLLDLLTAERVRSAGLNDSLSRLLVERHLYREIAVSLRGYARVNPYYSDQDELNKKALLERADRVLDETASVVSENVERPALTAERARSAGLREALREICSEFAQQHPLIVAGRAALASSGSPASGMEEAVREVVAERRRQVEAEGWTAEHDDEHTDGELVDAAACYLIYRGGHTPHRWPWSREWWKPKGHRRNLARAGALILAEIERIDRASSRSKTTPAPSDAQETI
jgi:hypothetical protein